MPRKTLARAASARAMRTASMRPRPDAAENGGKTDGRGAFFGLQ